VSSELLTESRITVYSRM